MHWLDEIEFPSYYSRSNPVETRPDPEEEAISTLQPQSNAFESPNSEIISTFLFYSIPARFDCLPVSNYLIRLCLLLNYVLMIELLETMPIPATNDDVNEWYQSEICAQEPLHWTCFPFNNPKQQRTAIPPEQQQLPPPTHFLIYSSTSASSCVCGRRVMTHPRILLLNCIIRLFSTILGPIDFWLLL